MFQRWLVSLVFVVFLVYLVYLYAGEVLLYILLPLLTHQKAGVSKGESQVCKCSGPILEGD